MTVNRLAIALLFASAYAAGAAAHPATERYVPIGYWDSVGVTGTYLGRVSRVAPRGESLDFVDEGVDKTIRITDRTRIYIDRSHLKMANLNGTRADLRAGRTMEVKLAPDGSAEWIKIRAER